MWSTEKTKALIEEYRDSICLWDVTSSDYKNRYKKKATIEAISKRLNVSSTDVEKKIHYLRSSFCREHRKIKEIKREGYVPWFAYDGLSFLLQVIEPKGNQKTGADNRNEIGSKPEEQLDQENSSIDEEAQYEIKPLTFKTHSINGKRLLRENEDMPMQQEVMYMEPLSEGAFVRDEHSVFGEHVANKMRHSKRPHLEISIAQHLIHEILLNLELEMYSNSNRERPAVTPSSFTFFKSSTTRKVSSSSVPNTTNISNIHDEQHTNK